MPNGDDNSGATRPDIWMINPTVSARDLENQISQELVQAEAMTSVIYGQGLENFNCMIDTEKDNYLWAVHMKIRGIRVLHEAFFHLLPREIVPSEAAHSKPILTVVGAERQQPD